MKPKKEVNNSEVKILKNIIVKLNNFFSIFSTTSSARHRLINSSYSQKKRTPSGISQDAAYAS